MNWTAARKEKLGFVDADDGSFWMSFKDFFSHFSRVGICTTLPLDYHTQTYHSSWEAHKTAGGRHRAEHDGTLYDLAKFNPRYEPSRASRAVGIVCLSCARWRVWLQKGDGGRKCGRLV